MILLWKSFCDLSFRKILRMKKLILLFLMYYNNSEAQIKLPEHSIDKNAASQVKEILPPNESNPIFIDPEVYPEFPGGEVALYKFISDNLLYPDSNKKVQGTVRVQFIIEEDGSISNVIVKRPFGYGLDEEAIRLVKSMPKWKPGSMNGKTVRMKYQIPIKLIL